MGLTWFDHVWCVKCTWKKRSSLRTTAGRARPSGASLVVLFEHHQKRFRWQPWSAENDVFAWEDLEKRITRQIKDDKGLRVFWVLITRRNVSRPRWILCRLWLHLQSPSLLGLWLGAQSTIWRLIWSKSTAVWNKHNKRLALLPMVCVKRTPFSCIWTVLHTLISVLCFNQICLRGERRDWSRWEKNHVTVTKHERRHRLSAWMMNLMHSVVRASQLVQSWRLFLLCTGLKTYVDAQRYLDLVLSKNLAGTGTPLQYPCNGNPFYHQNDA